MVSMPLMTLPRILFIEVFRVFSSVRRKRRKKGSSASSFLKDKRSSPTESELSSCTFNDWNFCDVMGRRDVWKFFFFVGFSGYCDYSSI